MPSHRSSPFAAAVLALATTLALASTTALDPAGAARLDALRRVPTSAGDLIYRGSVFAQSASVDVALFTYERRVRRTADGLTAASHITQAPNGEVLINEEAQFTDDYGLQRFSATNAQLGASGTVVLSNRGRHLEYRLVAGGSVSTATEDVDDPVVSGPSLHGFILHQWDALARGGQIPVRMIVLSSMQTYGFEIRRVAAVGGRTTFSVTPSDWLVRVAVKPLTVTFDSATRHVVRYEGRVPPMHRVDGELKPLDARVDYTMAAAAYR